MLKRGDKVRIIGSGYIEDFSEAVIIGNSTGIQGELELRVLVQLKNGNIYFIKSIYIFKEDSWIYKLIKLFKRKKYAKYQRTHKKCNEV